MIEARGLVKRYASTTAVDNLSFDVRPGTVTGFLGPNGAGKSTTMRMMIGLDRPDAGTLRINGKNYHDLHSPLREVGVLLRRRRSSGAHRPLAPDRPGGQRRHPRRRVNDVLEITGIEGPPARGQVLPGHGPAAGHRGRAALLGDPACCCSTSRSTAWTPRASGGSATC